MTPRHRTRAWLAVGLALALAGCEASARPPAAPTGDQAGIDVEAGAPPPAAVSLGGDIILWITTSAGPYSPQFRADRIGRRLEEVVRDRTLADVPVTVTEIENASELHAGSRLLMVVTAEDARNLGGPRDALAQQYARELDAAIRRERTRYLPGTLARSAVFALAATLALGLALWAFLRLTAALTRRLERWQAQRLGALRLQQAELVSAERLRGGIRRTLQIARIVPIVIAVNLYLTYVLALFPWTRPVSTHLLEYVLGPLQAAGTAFIAYLPNLVFVLVIGELIYLAIRLVGFFFDQIRIGRIVFTDFPPEWADPTDKIVRVLLVAFGLVVVFPYLPAANSPAFTGVSVFMGVLFSLASSSALSNMIAGIVLTYTGAFKVGDRVKIGDAFGDIVETALLATRVRTIKNEDITIPNSIVLGQSSTNYSRNAPRLGLILHTTVTIGYDTPWAQVHALLIEAALDTPDVQQEPRPFVWQTALNDFYVTYEINAYTATPRLMADTYAALHRRIQETFFAAGVEILSPHYTSLRDGNTVAIPPASRPPGYQAPGFRIAAAPAAVPSGRSAPAAD